MAAYASLVSLTQTIDKLQQQYDQDSTFLPEKQQIRCLQEHLVFLQAFLDDFPEKLANDLEARIGNAASRAEDIVEYSMSKEVGSSLEFAGINQKGHRLRFDFQALDQELREMTEEIDLIVEEVVEIKNSSRSTEDVKESDDFGDVIASSSSSSVPATTSRDSSMVGFDDDLMAIKTRLCGESSKLQFIPIVGMGGIGKTTLARTAYKDKLIDEHFDIRAWVTVSQGHCARDILSSLVVSVKGGRLEQGDESRMAETAYKSLKGLRYLIVMDDMWSMEAWDDVKRIFPNDHNGSRIMLTTRLLNVATYPDSRSPLHEMRFMDADQSWNLLKQKVFARKNCPPELERIGKVIARGCRGVPLAIVLIAGILSTLGKTHDSWNKIARNVNLAITRNDEQFARTVLSLSYNHLPHCLRPCFLHMGVFPEDYTIHASKLIKLWVAEGFLKPPETSISLEETGEEYLEDLVKRSLVLVIKRNGSGKIKRCCIHDLVRDLCIRKAREEKFLDHISRDRYGADLIPKSIKDQRRISIARVNVDFHANVDGSNMHTIICFDSSESSSLCFVRNLRLLRVLDVANAGGVSLVVILPDEVFQLFHLRYLAFDYSLTSIPAAISNLQNLQTLIIHPRKKMAERLRVSLPSEIWMMPRLRHLISFSFGALPEPIEETSALEHLQTLSEVRDLVCTEETLKMIPYLKKLGISFETNNDAGDYHLDNFVHLHQLENLKLQILSSFPRGVKPGLNPIFPTTLKKLTLRGKWGFSWKYLGRIVGSLPNLEVLKLRNRACDGETWETIEGEFRRLKSLMIKYSRLREWITESSHFPSLRCLKLYFCSNLREIPDGIGEIPTLELIEVDNRNKSLVKSAKRIQKEQQENWGTDALQVRRARRDLN